MEWEPLLFIQSLRAFCLALFSWFGGSGVLCGLVCLVGLVGLVWFCCLFFWNGKGSGGGCYFHISWSFFMDVWSLEVTFGEMLVSLGRLWTCLVPGGVQGDDLVEIVRSIRALLAPFWNHFWSITVICLRCFLRCFSLNVFCWWILNGFGSTAKRFLDNFCCCCCCCCLKAWNSEN